MGASDERQYSVLNGGRKAGEVLEVSEGLEADRNGGVTRRGEVQDEVGFCYLQTYMSYIVRYPLVSSCPWRCRRL